MARPQKHPDDRASAAFRVRRTAAERALLDTKATDAGCTVSQLVRAATLRYRLPPAPVTSDAVNELRRIGVNLNQIARHLNTTGDLRDWPELREALALYQQVLGDFLELILTRTISDNLHNRLRATMPGMATEPENLTLKQLALLRGEMQEGFAKLNAGHSERDGNATRHHSRKERTSPRGGLDDAPVRVEIYSSEETVEIFIEADFETLPEERRRFAILNIPRHQFSEATGAAARRAAKPAQYSD